MSNIERFVDAVEDLIRSDNELTVAETIGGLHIVSHRLMTAALSIEAGPIGESTLAANFRDALKRIARHGPIMSSTGDYRQGQLDILKSVSDIAISALAAEPQGAIGEDVLEANDPQALDCLSDRYGYAAPQGQRWS